MSTIALENEVNESHEQAELFSMLKISDDCKEEDVVGSDALVVKSKPRKTRHRVSARFTPEERKIRKREQSFRAGVRYRTKNTQKMIDMLARIKELESGAALRQLQKRVDDLERNDPLQYYGLYEDNSCLKIENKGLVAENKQLALALSRVKRDFESISLANLRLAEKVKIYADDNSQLRDVIISLSHCHINEWCSEEDQEIQEKDTK